MSELTPLSPFEIKTHVDLDPQCNSLSSYILTLEDIAAVSDVPRLGGVRWGFWLAGKPGRAWVLVNYQRLL